MVETTQNLTPLSTTLEEHPGQSPPPEIQGPRQTTLGLGTVLVLLLVVFVALTTWHQQQTDVEEKLLARADEELHAGELVEAARLYTKVARSANKVSPDASKKILDLLDKPARGLDATRSVALIQEIIPWAKTATEADQRLVGKHGLALAQQHRQQDPARALEILQLLALLPRPNLMILSHQKQLLELMVQRNPDQLGWTVRLAAFYEQQARANKILALLKPHQHRLGSSEGARILGLVYYNRKQWDQAEPLLLEYYRVNSESVENAHSPHHNTKTTNQQHQQDPDDVIPNLPETVPNAERVLLVARAIAQMYLQRGLQETNAEPRKQWLTRAADTLRLAREFSKDNQRFRRELAYVYFTLGRFTDAQAQVDQFLRETQRAPLTLLQLAHTYADIGAPALGLPFALEAHEKSNARYKQLAAKYHGKYAHNLAEQLTWLRRADAHDKEVQHLLTIVTANQDRRQPFPDHLPKKLSDAIDKYKNIPDPGRRQYFEAALHFQLYQLTWNRNDLDLARQTCAKALRPDNNDPTILELAAKLHLTTGLLDILGPNLDVKKVGALPQIDWIPFFIPLTPHGRAIAQRHVDDLGKNHHIHKALEYYERLRLRCPYHAKSYLEAARILAARNDATALLHLEKGGLQGDKDLIANFLVLPIPKWERMNDITAEKNAVAAERERVMRALEKEQGNVHLALVINQYFHARLGCMDPNSIDESLALLRQARRAHQVAPSRGTSILLRQALAWRAYQRLPVDLWHVNVMNLLHKQLMPEECLGLVLHQPGTRRAEALALPETREYLDLLRADLQNPASPLTPVTPVAWVQIRAVDETWARAIALTIVNDKTQTAWRRLHALWNSESMSAALAVYWQLEADEKPAEASNWRHRYTLRDLPFPIVEP